MSKLTESLREEYFRRMFAAGYRTAAEFESAFAKDPNETNFAIRSAQLAFGEALREELGL